MHVAIEQGQAHRWRDYLASIDVDTFLELYALSQVEPWGERREDLRWRMAQIIATRKPEDPEDLLAMLDYLKLGRPTSIDPEESRAACQEAFGGEGDEEFLEGWEGED